MSATVDILTETRENVVSVPISAVTTRIKNEDGGTREVDENIRNNSTDDTTIQRDEKQEVVFVFVDGRVVKTEVETGIQDNNSIEILNGIKAGDEVVTAPYTIINRTLKDSMLVKKVEEEDLYSDDE